VEFHKLSIQTQLSPPTPQIAEIPINMAKCDTKTRKVGDKDQPLMEKVLDSRNCRCVRSLPINQRDIIPL
jgi:hypothetical protein